jgi:uncharacterized protein with PQ loop repeat
VHTCTEKNTYIRTANPHPIHEVSFHVVNTAVWCAMMARKIWVLYAILTALILQWDRYPSPYKIITAAYEARKVANHANLRHVACFLKNK